MKPLLIVVNALDKITRKVGRSAAWIVMPLIFVIMFDVVTRKTDFTRLYFADFTIEYGYSVSTILQDMEWHMHGVLLLLTFGIGYLQNAHVRVDIFRERLSRRNQAWVEFMGLVIFSVPFLLLMLYFSWILTSISFLQGEGSESMTGIQKRWIIKSFTIIGFSVVLLAVFATMGRLIAYLFGNPDEKQAAYEALSVFCHEDDAERELEEAKADIERRAHADKLEL